jgi:hypothetical protein
LLVPVGPGERASLADTLASVHAFEPAAKVVVSADGADDLAAADVEAAFPGAALLRPPRPSGGPPLLSPPIAWAYRWAVRNLRFDVLCKLDTDALLTGPGLVERAAAEFARDPGVGMLGTVAMRADGSVGDTTYSAWVLAHERRWSRSVRALDRAARGHGYAGEEAHGGVYLLSRAALEALDASGALTAQPPWWSLIGEDLWFSLGVRATGLRIGAFGAPDGPIVSGQGFLPIAKERVLADGILAVHSVRRGARGEDEDELRAFFRAARERAAANELV